MGSQKALAKKIQKSESSVSTTLSLLNLHPAIIAKHRNDGVLCEKQLLQIPLGSLEDQQEAYDRIINLKQAKNSGGKPGGQDLVRKKADLLANAIMRLDPKKVGSAELADICVRVFSIIGLIASYLAKTPSVDPNAVSEVIRTASFSLKQTTERLDLSQVNTNDLNRAFQWSIEILKCIANWTLQFENERIYLCGEIFFLKNQARHMSRKLNSEVHLKSPHI